MKKLLIATAALAMVAGTAQAQSSVTVYGVLDMGYSNVESKTAAGVTTETKTTGAEGQASGNRLGFRGVEDLGGGLKANFVLEWSHTPSETGAAVGATNRQSFVGLSGAFGEASIGRMNTLHKYIQDNNTFGGPSFGTGWTATMNGYNADRISNVIQYKTPTFSGLSATVQLVDNASDVSNVAGENISGSGMAAMINYKAGKFELAYANGSVKDTGAAIVTSSAPLTPSETATENKRKIDSVLATYDFGVAKAFLVSTKAKVQTTGVTGDAKAEDTTIGVRVPMGKFALLAQYGEGEQTLASTGAKTDTEGYQLGVQYSLSKRTTAYAYYGDQESKAVGAATAATADGYTMGIRHSF
jgi:general bacterial porin, GBP family